MSIPFNASNIYPTPVKRGLLCRVWWGYGATIVERSHRAASSGLVYFSFFLFFFLAMPALYRSSQAREGTYATAVTQAAVVTMLDPEPRAPQGNSRAGFFMRKMALPLAIYLFTYLF